MSYLDDQFDSYDPWDEEENGWEDDRSAEEDEEEDGETGDAIGFGEMGMRKTKKERDEDFNARADFEKPDFGEAGRRKQLEQMADAYLGTTKSGASWQGDSMKDEVGYELPFDYVAHETPKAVLFKLTDRDKGRDLWVPRSQIIILNEPGHVVHIKPWFAKKCGWGKK